MFDAECKCVLMLLKADCLLPLVPEVFLAAVERCLQLLREVVLDERLDVGVEVDDCKDCCFLFVVVCGRQAQHCLDHWLANLKVAVYELVFVCDVAELAEHIRFLVGEVRERHPEYIAKVFERFLWHVR
jgi:hypothetical protein